MYKLASSSLLQVSSWQQHKRESPSIPGCHATPPSFVSFLKPLLKELQAPLGGKIMPVFAYTAQLDRSPAVSLFFIACSLALSFPVSLRFVDAENLVSWDTLRIYLSDLSE